MLLNVVILRLRRPIRDKPTGYLRFAALATKRGEISGLGPTQKELLIFTSLLYRIFGSFSIAKSSM